MSDGPVVLISGTSRGVGAHLARHYADTGARVVGCSRSTGPGEFANYQHIRADVSNAGDVRALFAAVRQQFGRLDVLINSAAVNPTIALSVLTPPAVIQEAVAINLVAPMLMCREAVKLMARARFGRIINIGSMAAKLEVAGESVYTVTKAGLNSYTRVLAKEVNSLGITCNVVAPSAVPVGLAGQIDAAALNDVLSRNAIPAMGTLADITNAIDWLIRAESQAITGQIVYLGGV